MPALGPTPPPTIPLPAACLAADQAVCPGLQHRGVQCRTCLNQHKGEKTLIFGLYKKEVAHLERGEPAVELCVASHRHLRHPAIGALLRGKEVRVRPFWKHGLQHHWL